MLVNLTLFKPYPRQQDIINACISNDDINYVVVTKGRQVGLTLTGINLSIYWALTDANTTTLIIQPTGKQLRKVLRQFEIGLASFKGKKINKTDMSIEFNNGSIIRLLSGESKDGIRGYTAHYLWVDEAAFISDEVWDSAIRPTTTISTAGKKILLTSTPKGKSNFFFRMYNSGIAKTFSLPSKDSPFITQQELDLAKVGTPKALYRQEYEGEFIDDGGEVFNNIESCAVINEWQVYNYNIQYFAGIDWAREDDKSVLTILTGSGEVAYVKQLKGIKWNDIVTQFAFILNEYKASCLVEVNSIGSVLFEELIKIYPNVYEFQTSNKSKEEIVLTAVKAFNERSVKIPTKNLYPELINELTIFTFEYLPVSRTIRYTHPPGMHDDHVISFCLANKWRIDHMNIGYRETGTYRNERYQNVLTRW